MYSGRCNLGYDRLLQIHVEKKRHYWRGLHLKDFWTDINMHSLEVVLRTKQTSLNFEGFEFRLFGPF